MNFAERARGLVSAAPYFALPLQNFTTLLATACTVFKISMTLQYMEDTSLFMSYRNVRATENTVHLSGTARG